MKSVVVMPTYNEAKNIKKILSEVLKHDVEVLVVDDNSPDGTGDIVRKMKSKRVHIITGEKVGLGDAYMRGLQHARKKLKADVLIEMDADFSHDPQDIPRLISGIEDGADFVIGSRNMKESRIEGWGWHRYVNSWVARVIGRIAGGFHDVKDISAGYRAIKGWVVDEVDWESFDAPGYSFQPLFLYEAKRLDARILEIPVVFVDRKEGQSKVGSSDIIDYLRVSMKMAWRTYGRLVKFGIVGVTGIAVNVGVFSGLVRLLGAANWLGVAIGVELSILWNFFWHEQWTFHDRRIGKWIDRCVKYHYTSLLGAVITFGLALWLIPMFGLPEIGLLIAIGAGTLSNFLLSYFWAWKKA